MGRHLGDGQPVTRRAVLASLGAGPAARPGRGPAWLRALVVLVLAHGRERQQRLLGREEVGSTRVEAKSRRRRRHRAEGGDATDGAEAALAEYLKGQGHEYVGDCADAELPRDKGKWCSTLKSGDPAGDTETYDVGPVGEKPEKTVTVSGRGAAGSRPATRSASPRATWCAAPLTRESSADTCSSPAT